MAPRTTRTRAAAKVIVQPAARPSAEIGTQDLIDPEETTEMDAIAELRGMGASGEHKFTVTKIAGKPGERCGYCATFGVGELSLDAIREQFGGGKYTIRVTQANGQYVTNRTVEIVDLPRTAAAAVPAAAPPQDMNGLAAVIAAMKPNGNGGGNDLATLVTLMMKQQESTTQMILGMMNRPVPAGPSLTDLLALINANKPEGDNSVKLLLQGLELGKTLGGGETGMLDVAREGLGLLAPLIHGDGSQDHRPAPHRAPRVLAAPEGAAPTTTAAAPVRAANPQGNAPMMQKLTWLKAQTAALVLQASREKDPELYAEVMLDNLPPYISEDEIFERMNEGNAVAQLAMLDPRVNQFAPWFEAFRVAVIGLLTEDGEEEPAPGQPAHMPAPGSDPVDGAG